MSKTSNEPQASQQASPKSTPTTAEPTELDHLVADIWDNKATIDDLRTYVHQQSVLAVVAELEALLGIYEQPVDIDNRPIGNAFIIHNEATLTVIEVRIETLQAQLEALNNSKEKNDE